MTRSKGKHTLHSRSSKNTAHSEQEVYFQKFLVYYMLQKYSTHLRNAVISRH